jgi:hypothetical protein
VPWNASPTKLAERSSAITSGVFGPKKFTTPLFSIGPLWMMTTARGSARRLFALALAWRPRTAAKLAVVKYGLALRESGVSAGRHVAIWIASIVFFVLGAIWYSVMATPWVAAIGKTMDELSREHAASPLPYVVAFVAILVMCYTLAWLMHRLQVATLFAGLRLGAIVAIGFITATLALNYGFEARSITLWLINSAYPVVGLALAGAIIGGWKRATG